MYMKHTYSANQRQPSVAQPAWVVMLAVTLIVAAPGGSLAGTTWLVQLSRVANLRASRCQCTARARACTCVLSRSAAMQCDHMWSSSLSTNACGLVGLWITVATERSQPHAVNRMPAAVATCLATK